MEGLPYLKQRWYLFLNVVRPWVLVNPGIELGLPLSGLVPDQSELTSFLASDGLVSFWWASHIAILFYLNRGAVSYSFWNWANWRGTGARRQGCRKSSNWRVGAHKLKKPPLPDQMHVILWVIKANDIRFEKGVYSDTIKFVQYQASEQSEFFTFLIVHMSFKGTQIRGSPKGFFNTLIPTQNFEQSRNPDGYFKHILSPSCAYFQSRIPIFK